MTLHANLPISLHVRRPRTVVLVGEGDSARARLRQLQDLGLNVVHRSADGFTRIPEQAFVVMAHTDDRALDQGIVERAREAGCLAYAHDQPGISDFAMPALARRGPLALAVNTSGTAPLLAGRLRRLLQGLLDQAGDALDDLLTAMREARQLEPRARRLQALRALAQRVTLEGRLRISPGDDPDEAEPDADPTR